MQVYHNIVLKIDITFLLTMYAINNHTNNTRAAHYIETKFQPSQSWWYRLYFNCMVIIKICDGVSVGRM